MGIVLSRLRGNSYAQVESTENPPVNIKASYLSTDLVSFFVFGCLNNLIYVIILSAAVDLVGSLPKAIVLLANILPSLAIKLVGPYFILKISYSVRICTCAILSIFALQIIAWSESISYRLFGVVLASLSSGLGEMTFLMLTSRYQPETIAAWSSGTGGAGLLGSLAFLALTTWLQLSVRTSLMLVSPLPGLMAYTYFFLVRNSSYSTLPGNPSTLDEEVEDILAEDVTVARPTLRVINNDTVGAGEIDEGMLSNVPRRPEDMTFGEKLMLVRPLVMRFILPLFVVYWAEYTINQGVAPTLYFPLEQTPFHEMRDHYVTYQALYQLGVFIARSSVTILPIRRIWIPSLLQMAVLVALAAQSVWGWIPNVYFVFLIILGEGLLGGTVYVNAFHRIRIEVPDPYKEFSLGVVGVADGAGITVAGMMSLWLEPALCCADVASVCCKMVNKPTP